MKNREKGNIPGFSNYYISRTGKLYSKFTGSWKLVKPAMKDNGYLSNSLVGDDGKRKNFYRHRLVASTYIPNPNHYKYIRYKNGNLKDWRIENLYWESYTHKPDNKSKLTPKIKKVIKDVSQGQVVIINIDRVIIRK